MVLVLLGVIHVASENTVCIPNTSSVLGIHKSVLLYTLCIALKIQNNLYSSRHSSIHTILLSTIREKLG